LAAPRLMNKAVAEIIMLDCLLFTTQQQQRHSGKEDTWINDAMKLSIRPHYDDQATACTNVHISKSTTQSTERERESERVRERERERDKRRL